ncbi:hypothetical protein [Botrimarina sp.]|uniref:hypothetical protein n=1 Tax=Botrimarina sp. TaxID=2795802 RepID=UPI0032EBDD2B
MDRDAFDPEIYGRSLAEAIGDEPLMPLGAASPDASRRAELSSLAGRWREELSEEPGVGDRSAFNCCVAAVWLLHNFLDEAHALSQEALTPEGSYWHGVVHRREGDYGNAKYWFRRVGDHPVGSIVASAAAEHPETVECALGGKWDPLAFVEKVHAVAAAGGPEADACQAVQRAEWRALFDWCYRRAVGR